MGLTLGEAIRHITNRNYAIVAADLFEDCFGRKYVTVDRIPAKDKGSWPIKIEDKLKDTHFAKMAEGEFKRTRVDIASDTYLEVKQWVEDQIGVPHPCIDHDFKLGIK